MTERKTILIYDKRAAMCANFHALLGDYFTICLLKKPDDMVTRLDKLQAVLAETKPGCLIMDISVDGTALDSFVHGNPFPIIIRSTHDVKEYPGYKGTIDFITNEVKPSGGVFGYVASSDELLKLIDKAVGLPELKNRRYFTFADEKSSKFWSIEKEGASYLVNFGKIGSEGQKTEKTFGSEADCQKEIDKLIAEKTKKGYVEKTDRSFVNND
jgi:predicted DNA-binding WGR domain protein